MRAALLLLLYALAVAWWAPAPLSRLTARGVSPRLGLAAWLTAMASALASAAAALAFLVRSSVDGWSRLAAVVCVSGRPGTIVLTSGALALLDPAQLAAVLAHERAHLASRHHLVIALTRGLAAVFPAVPLFARSLENVARLAEMCADDDAARHSGRPALAAALLVMATGAAVPALALGAMACAVTARLQRLAEAPRRARHARYGLALTLVMLLLAGGPATLALIPA